jgi:histidinol phosphatase-like PHP family hydrolase
MLRHNLHNHTTWSDGTHDLRLLHEAALNAGLTHLGVSDHFVSTRLPPERCIPLERVAAYLDEVRRFSRSHPRPPRILAGLELNFSLVQTDFSFLSRVDPDENPLNKADFLLFENVNDAESFGLGLEELLKIRPLFNVPVGLSHPDLERSFSGAVAPATLAKLLVLSDIFLELCPTRRHSRPAPRGDDFLPYYRVESEFMKGFWAAARREKLAVAIGGDTHDDLGDIGTVDDAARFIEEQGLEGNALVQRWSAR